MGYPNYEEYLLPNGQHDGNVWLRNQTLLEPEIGRFTMTCDTCFGQTDGHNWKCASPAMYNREGDTKHTCDECKTAAHSSKPYAKYLQSPHWQRIRGEALERSKFRCQLCAASWKLNVHHNTYKNKGREQPEDVIVLCRDCHSKHHGKVA